MRRTPPWASLPLLALAACGADVQLGTVARPDAGVLEDATVPDAEVDAGELDAGHDAGVEDRGPPPPPPPPPPLEVDGRYQLSFVPGPEIDCEGSLVDLHDAFVDMFPSQVDLHDGQIEVKKVGSQLDVWGEPVQLAFAVERLSLQETDVSGVFLGWTPRNRVGPEDTREDLARLRMDIEVPYPLTPETKAQIRYVATDSSGECLVSFRGLLTPL